jgi:predicted XRE-type DNA-binding protein
MAKRKTKTARIEPLTGMLTLGAANPVVKIEPSSGNVFADLGLADAEELDTKVRLAVELVRALDARDLSQVEAARLLKVSQPKVSALKAYKLEGFSVERLMTFLTALGRDIEIRITARSHAEKPGRIHVQAA